MSVNVSAGERHFVECENCGTVFRKTPCNIKKCEKHFCSPECYRDWKKENSETKIVECDNPGCKNKTKVIPSEQKRYDHHYCSIECCNEHKHKMSEGDDHD